MAHNTRTGPAFPTTTGRSETVCQSNRMVGTAAIITRKAIYHHMAICGWDEPICTIDESD